MFYTSHMSVLPGLAGLERGRCGAEAPGGPGDGGDRGDGSGHPCVSTWSPAAAKLRLEFQVSNPSRFVLF